MVAVSTYVYADPYKMRAICFEEFCMRQKDTWAAMKETLASNALRTGEKFL